MEVQLTSSLAAAKILLHAFKHPFGAVNGILIGKIQSSQAVVVDAIPLFHEHLYLAPMFEVAMLQVSWWFKQPLTGLDRASLLRDE